MDSVLALHLAALGSTIGVPKNLSSMLLIFIDSTAENSRQRLVDVN